VAEERDLNLPLFAAAVTEKRHFPAAGRAVDTEPFVVDEWFITLLTTDVYLIPALVLNHISTISDPAEKDFLQNCCQNE
jgi:hypothetical protein